MGFFTENTEQEFTGVTNGDVKFGDLDGDGDQDLIISGSGNSSIPYTTLYWNDGVGGFTADLVTSFQQLEGSLIDLADIDGDDDLDILITGRDMFLEGHTIIYENDFPNQDFILIQDNPSVQLRSGETSFFDIDKDHDMDIMLLGETGSSLDFVVKLYLNDGDGNYEEQSDFISMNPLTKSAFEVLDFDNDSDNDILVIGEEGSSNNVIKLFANDGNTNFSNVEEVSPFLGGLYN